MSQQHLDRLSAVDAGFLAQEGPTTHMHIGGVALFDGEPPGLGEFLEHIGSRLHLVPRYRQKLAFPPLGTGRPLWVDDPTFNLAYHVRHSALPAPGSERALLDLTARIFSQPLDRTKPLWELWLVEGRESGGFALIAKTHHSLVDGISGLDLTSVLFDLSEETVHAEAPAEPWAPQPEPSAASLAAAGLAGAARTAVEVASGTAAAAASPQELLDRAREVAAGIGEVAWAGINAPPPTPFNVPPGPHRRIRFVRAGLDEFKAVKDALGGTVNDAVLAVVTGGLAYFLQARGQDTAGLELRACVPVSVRTEAQAGGLGNQLTQILAPLPVGIDEPVARLRYVRDAMRDLKESRQALGAKAIAAAQDFAPPTIMAQASRLTFAGRFYNVLVTNVPGPQFPLYILGRRLDAMFPIAFLAGDRALAVAIMSYDGGMNFGLIGDYDALPDLDVIAEGIEGSLAALTAAARKAQRTEARKARRRAAPAKASPRGRTAS
ncbi:MAG: wax ester/triacylglycerol synthase family O-acyltransferase [Actinomycetota bacterium]|nr:wax ester/triacylglycerol synthase family O-acyltransferase [Actinomycetota bacterium]